MKSLLSALFLALACATAQAAEPVPVIEQAVAIVPDETVAEATSPAPAVASVPPAAVPEPDGLPMLAVGAVLVLLRLSRKGRNDTFE